MQHQVTWLQMSNFFERAEAYTQLVRTCSNGKCNNGNPARILIKWKHCPNCGAKQPNLDTPERTKFRHIIERNLTLLAAKKTEYDNLRRDIAVKYALEDEENGKRLRVRDENGNYDYDRAGTESSDKALRDLLITKVNINPIFAPVVPDNLTDLELEHFSGIAIIPDTVERIRRERDLDILPGVTRLDREGDLSELLFRNPDSREVGRLVWDSGKFTFTGNADESASALLSAVNQPAEPEKSNGADSTAVISSGPDGQQKEAGTT